MRLRRALSFAALGIGAAAATNAALERSAGELPPALDGMQRTFRWRGMNVAYTEAGDTADPDLVLVHGLNAAGSSGEWRKVVEALSEEYHVLAPDLPGFGNSERPPLRYSAALYEDFLADFLAEFDDPTVMASSLSGAYVAAVADEVDVSRLVLVCPTSVAGPSEPKPWLRELVRLPLVGQLAFNMVSSKRAIRYFNADHGYAHPDDVDEAWEEYEWLTAHQRNARFAPASFVAGYLNSEVDLGETLAALDVPTTILWGREADISTVADGRDIATAAGCELVVFDDAKLLPHVERAGAVVDYVLAGDLPGDRSAVVEYDPAHDQEATAAGDTDAAASTDSLTDDADDEMGAAEPAEAAEPTSDDPEADDTDVEASEDAEPEAGGADDAGAAADETPVAETDAAADTESMVDEADEEAGAAEPAEAAAPASEEPDEGSEDAESAESDDTDEEGADTVEADGGEEATEE